MNLIKIFSILAISGLAACSSKVVTYDATGKIIGSCMATRGLLSTASAHCSGSGDALGVNYNTPNAATVLLPTPPIQNQINLKP